MNDDNENKAADIDLLFQLNIHWYLSKKQNLIRDLRVYAQCTISITLDKVKTGSIW